VTTTNTLITSTVTYVSKAWSKIGSHRVSSTNPGPLTGMTTSNINDQVPPANNIQAGSTLRVDN
jgi:hypothetical protein